MTSLFFKSSLGDERGVFVLIVAGVSLGLLLLSALAIDGGTLFISRLAAQSAADAGAISAAGLIATNENDPDIVERAKNAARLMAFNNLVQKGIDPAHILQPINVQYRELSSGRVLRVNVALNVKTYLMGILPGTSGAGTLRAVASSQVSPASISVILDTSKSMNCPAGSFHCKCLPDCPDVGSKMEALRGAVNSFLGNFNTDRDRVNLVAFGTGAELLVPMNIQGGFDLAGMREQVDALTGIGETNVSDAIWHSYLDVERVGRENETAYVFFTDGAPTAGRFLLESPYYPDNPDIPNDILGRGWSRWDFLTWATNWGDEPPYQSAAYSLIKTPDPNNMTWSVHPRLHPGGKHPEGAEKILTSYVIANDPLYAFGSFLHNIEMHTPDGEKHRVGRLWGSSADGRFSWKPEIADYDYREEFYNAGLLMTDFTKKQGGAWFVVGLGAASPRAEDPYQGAAFSFNRKDYWLTRVANDPCGMILNDPGFPGFMNYQEMKEAGWREGMYLPTPDAEELRALFERIARKIKLSLVR